jgi:hypothetical protein
MQLAKTVQKTVTVEASCAGCIFFAGATKLESPKAPPSLTGICRRSPPAPNWPEVSSGDWCGEYGPKAGW